MDALNEIPQEQNQASPTTRAASNLLGFSTTELAGLSVEELHKNKTAITMLLHYYTKLVDENSALKNEKNTLETYVESYENKKTYSLVAAWLLTLSNLLTGFGINLLTNGSTWPGLATLLPGIGLIVAGLYFSNREPI